MHIILIISFTLPAKFSDRQSISKTMKPRSFQRLASTAASALTRRLADDLLEKTRNAPLKIGKQFLDPNQLQRLSLTLNRPQLYQDIQFTEGEASLKGMPVPPGYHLVYFTPAALPDELGVDGTDISYSPAEPFTRRMWAGGEVQWEKDNPLRIGDEATETTRLVSAEPKATRSGEKMIVVGVEKIFENAKGVALIDRRDWVFRTQLGGQTPAPDYPVSPECKDELLPAPEQGMESRDFLQTAVSLFRFSALTFNAHQSTIHSLGVGRWKVIETSLYMAH